MTLTPLDDDLSSTTTIAEAEILLWRVFCGDPVQERVPAPPVTRFNS
jgi:hypothetical protein